MACIWQLVLNHTTLQDAVHMHAVPLHLQTFLQESGKTAAMLAYDRPSPKLKAFLAKHYGKELSLLRLTWRVLRQSLVSTLDPSQFSVDVLTVFVVWCLQVSSPSSRRATTMWCVACSSTGACTISQDRPLCSSC